MNDCSYEYDSYQDFDEEQQTQIKSDACSAHIPQGVRGSDLTRKKVKDNPHKSRAFTKIFDLGADRVAHSSLFNRATKVLLILLRDSAIGGAVYTSTRLIAEELVTDQSNARKILRQLEDEDFILKVDHEKVASPFYLLNPYCFIVGDMEVEERAKRRWAIELQRKQKREGKQK